MRIGNSRELCNTTNDNQSMFDPIQEGRWGLNLTIEIVAHLLVVIKLYFLNI